MTIHPSHIHGRAVARACRAGTYTLMLPAESAESGLPNTCEHKSEKERKTITATGYNQQSLDDVKLIVDAKKQKRL